MVGHFGTQAPSFCGSAAILWSQGRPGVIPTPYLEKKKNMVLPRLTT